MPMLSVALHFNHIACFVAIEPRAQLDACSVALQLEAEMLNATIPQIFPLLFRALLGVNVDRGYVFANHAQ